MQSLTHSHDGIFHFDESDVEDELDIARLSLNRQPSYYLEEGVQEMDIEDEIAVDTPGTFSST
jgi:hypothetical protein